ncbi:hypothetical protein [[Mycoplasma] mobile]|uniref:Transmembrane protein n=1 Tax=Mycoplasma mobile (strain ATCC 43663 / 163K / NCTC 11711) TaxID=267748 RepID=Q6KHQ1_MYCM1|nr:hypothetical protein [[Mycoplasma] mobile]AAT27877.1 hypothetical protein MMOB3910 [Mycoplasma mobile 163K]
MNFFTQSQSKVNLNNILFYSFLSISLISVILIVISGLVSLLSTDQLNSFIIQKKLENLSMTEAFDRFKLESIVKIFVNSIVIIFFGIYSYFGYSKIKVGYVFVIFWTFLWIGNILSSWLLTNELWYSIFATLISIGAIIALFYLFVLLHQNNFYLKNKERW